VAVEAAEQSDAFALCDRHVDCFLSIVFLTNDILSDIFIVASFSADG
jgi:hypothetical protein